MADGPFQRFRRFLAELKRRKVYRVAAVYAAVAFVTLQAAQLIFPATTLKGIYDVLVVIAFVGFPIALVMAWAFELTPEGVSRTPEVEQTEEAEAREGGTRTAYKVLIGLGLVGAAAAGGWYLTGGRGEPDVGGRSVAVLPFKTLSDSASLAFTQGLHSDVLTRLQRISNLTVIARPSVMRYSETSKPLSQVARELGARWIVTADVQTAGNQIKVQARLIDPRRGTERWSSSYRRKLFTDTFFTLQSDITKDIVRSLQAQLSSQERQRIGHQPTESSRAYKLYFEGRRFSQLNEDYRAIDRFQRAIKLDSTFALAWAGLADAALPPISGTITDSTVVGKKVGRAIINPQEAAKRAVQLDPNLAEGHIVLGHLSLRDQNGTVALRELGRALELKRSSFRSQELLTKLLAVVGERALMLRSAKRAVELNPSSPKAQELLSLAYLINGDTKQALVHAELSREAIRQLSREVEVETHWRLQFMERFPGFVKHIYLHGGRPDTAFADNGVPLQRGPQVNLVNVAASLLQGDSARAVEFALKWGLGGSSQVALPKNFGRVEVALAHAAIGELDRAFGLLRGLDWRWEQVVKVRYYYPDILGQFRDDPRYDNLIRRIEEKWSIGSEMILDSNIEFILSENAG